MNEPDPFGTHKALLGMPARIIKDEKDDAPNTRAALLCEGVEKRLEERFGDAIRDIPEGLASRRRDESGDVEPFITGMPGRDWPLSARRPDAPQDRLQTDPVLIACKDFDRRIGIFRLFLGGCLAKLFLKAAASSGVADFGFFGRGFWIVQPIARNASQARCANTEVKPNSCAIHTAIFGVVHTPPSGGGSTRRARSFSRSSGVRMRAGAPLPRRRSPSASGP